MRRSATAACRGVARGAGTEGPAPAYRRRRFSPVEDLAGYSPCLQSLLTPVENSAKLSEPLLFQMFERIGLVGLLYFRLRLSRRQHIGNSRRNMDNLQTNNAQMAMPPALNKLQYSREEAAEMLGISLRTMDRLIAQKDIPVRRIGRRVLIGWDDLTRAAKKSHPIAEVVQ